MSIESKERRLKFLDSIEVGIVASLRVRVNYTLDFASLLRRSERSFDHISDGLFQMRISDIFKGLQDVNVNFAAFDNRLENFYYPWEIQRVMERVNMRPANIREVIATLTQRRRAIEKLTSARIFRNGFPATGSVANDHSDKKYIIAISGYRGQDFSLDKRIVEAPWPAYCLFPGIRLS